MASDYETADAGACCTECICMSQWYLRKHAARVTSSCIPPDRFFGRVPTGARQHNPFHVYFEVPHNIPVLYNRRPLLRRATWVLMPVPEAGVARG